MIENIQPPHTNINIPIAGNQNPIKYIEEQYHGKIIDVEEFKELHSELHSWMKVLMRWENDFKKSFIIVKHIDEGVNNRVGIYLFTSKYEYKISARKPNKRKKSGYLGCIASTRKNRAGEQWNRGSDLHDGPYSEVTFNGILADIVAYELVKQEAL